jgi:hypothetical protein
MRVAAVISLIALALSTSANGQTSSQIATQNPIQTYTYFKRTFERLRVAPEAVAQWFIGVGGIVEDKDEVPLADCVRVWEYVGYDGYEADNSILENAASIAFDVLYMRQALLVAGYPASVWQNDLAEYERASLADIAIYESRLGEQNRAREDLAKKLNKYNKSMNGAHKKLTPARECGGGEVEVVIKTRPPARRVQYINLVKYELCSFQGLDPIGPECDRWVDYAALPSQQGANMSGRYKVRVTWLDGSSEFRDLNVDDLAQGREWSDPRVFSIRKQYN